MERSGVERRWNGLMLVSGNKSTVEEKPEWRHFEYHNDTLTKKPPKNRYSERAEEGPRYTWREERDTW